MHVKPVYDSTQLSTQERRGVLSIIRYIFLLVRKWQVPAQLSYDKGQVLLYTHLENLIVHGYCLYSYHLYTTSPYHQSDQFASLIVHGYHVKT